MSRPLCLTDLHRVFTHEQRPYPLPSGTVLLHRGLTLQDAHTFSAWLDGDCIEEPTWADHEFRRVWVHYGERYTVTYCEGDIEIVVCPDAATWGDWLNHSATFYARR